MSTKVLVDVEPEKLDKALCRIMEARSGAKSAGMAVPDGSTAKVLCRGREDGLRIAQDILMSVIAGEL